MASQDNPIFSVINETLGLGGGPKSYEDKVDRLRKTLAQQGIIEGSEPTVDVVRKAGLMAELGGFEEFGRGQGTDLFNKLKKSGLVPNSAKTVFENLTEKGSLFYRDTSLFFMSPKVQQKLPLESMSGIGTFYGGKLRKSSRVLGSNIYSEPTVGGATFADEFYSTFTFLEREGPILDDPTLLSASKFRFRQVLEDLQTRGFQLESGITAKGIIRPEEAYQVSRKNIVQPSAFGLEEIVSGPQAARPLLSEQYRAGINILTKTAGSLGALTSVMPDEHFSTVQEAFIRLDEKRKNLFTSIASFYQEPGNRVDPSSFVFVKPEYIGGQKSIKVADPAYSKMYGTQFEAHTLSKGLYQLAKTEIAPVGTKTPYAFKSLGIMNRMNTALRVAVLETGTVGQSLGLFGEGGALLTEEGALKFKRKLNVGSVNLSGASDATKQAVENLFNISLGGASEQVFTSPKVALQGQDIKGLRNAFGKSAGLLDVILKYGDDVGLQKIQLSETGLRLDFGTTRAVTPETVEMLIAARRHSAALTETSHPLHGFINSSALRDLGVDAVMSADEYAKTFGPQVFVSNFIDQVSKRQDAAKIFKNVFGHNGWKHGEDVIVGDDFNSAFYRARAATVKGGYLTKLKADSSTGLSGTELIRRIREGQALDISGIDSKLGVTGARVFGMSGAFRTDFMDDINMLNPLRLTASKMVTLASGYQTLGYASATDDPLVRLFSQASKDWRGQGANFEIDSVTGRLKIGKNNLIRQFAEILSGTKALSPSHKASFSNSNVLINKDGLSIQGKKLSLMPKLEQFGFSEGGVSLTQLKNTILDPSRNMVYLDLGKKVDISIGGRKVGMQHLPIPVGLLRKAKGPYDRVIMGVDDPAYGFVKAIGDLEESLDFDSLRQGEVAADRLSGKNLEEFSKAYERVVSSLIGKDALAEKSSSILFQAGTRARLAPSKTGFFLGQNAIDKMLTAEVSESELLDFFERKQDLLYGDGRTANVRSQFDFIRNKIAKGEKDIYVMLSADPAQRAEHFQVMKLNITGRGQPSRLSQKLGQLNVSVSPFILKMMERDLDRDVINMLFLTGMRTQGGISPEELQKQLADRYRRSTEALRPFATLYGAELEQAAEEEVVKTRLGSRLRAGLIKGREMIGNLAETLMGYEGGQKSLGYTIVRSGEDLMATLAGRMTQISSAEEIGGTLRSAMSELGLSDVGRLEGSGLRTSMFESFVGEEGGRRLSATRNALQALYQGAVQKAGDKAGLEELGELIGTIGEQVSKRAFSYEKSLNALEANLSSIIEAQSEGNKLRAFSDLSFIQENYDELVSGGKGPSLSMMLDDLAKGADENLLASAKRGVIAGQAKLMAEFLLPGIIARKTIGSGDVQLPENILRGKASEGEDVFRKLFRSLGITAAEGLEEATSVASEAGTTAQVTKGAFSSFLDFMSSSRGRTFATGVGVGAVAAMGIQAIMANEAPMPRDIDMRQPEDTGPEVFSSAPRVYGSSSPMHASRARSPVMPGNIDGYTMYSSASPMISITDKRSSFDPHLIDSHIRSVSRSDYTY